MLAANCRLEGAACRAGILEPGPALTRLLRRLVPPAREVRLVYLLRHQGTVPVGLAVQDHLQF